MKSEEIKNLKDLCDKATPGPWDAPLKDLGEVESFQAVDFYFDHSFEVYPPLGYSGPIFVASGLDDAAFMVAARTAVPELIKEIEACWKRIDRLTDMVDNGEKF